jgi:DNA invertase Pin-like site-specific DNA recombinase
VQTGSLENLEPQIASEMCSKNLQTTPNCGSWANNGQDPEVQTRELREYCQRRGWEVSQEYVDVGISGAKEKRPDLDKLFADAHRRHFEAVMVWRFDRFARSVSHLLRALETFRSLGIEFVSLSKQVDTSTPRGKMIFTVLGAVAELERNLILERVWAGLRNARCEGQETRQAPEGTGRCASPGGVLLPTTR